jgi:hypothetical protein
LRTRKKIETRESGVAGFRPNEIAGVESGWRRGKGGGGRCADRYEEREKGVIDVEGAADRRRAMGVEGRCKQEGKICKTRHLGGSWSVDRAQGDGGNVQFLHKWVWGMDRKENGNEREKIK